MPCCFLASIPYNYAATNDTTKTIRLEIEQQYADLIKDLGKKINQLMFYPFHFIIKKT